MRLAPALACLALAACGERHPVPALPAAADALPLVERVGLAQQLPLGTDDAQKALRAGQIARVRSLGVKHLRVDFTWHKLERKPGEWDFTPLDPVVEEATAAGIELLALAGYGNPIYPSEAGQGAPGADVPLDNPPEVDFPPTDPKHYADFVAKIAARYGDRVHAFELWNEENIGYRFWRPTADPAAYAHQTKLAVDAGREACPTCRFVLGGLSMPQPVPKLDLYQIGPVFLQNVYQAEPALNAWIDAIGYHPYQYPKDPPEFETAPFPDVEQGSLATQTAELRQTEAQGAGTPPPLWITENGWPTNPHVPQDDAALARVFGLDPKVIAFGRSVLGEDDFKRLVETVRGVSEENQARYLVRSVLLAAQLGVEKTYLYTLDDSPVEPDVNQEAAFGVFHGDGTEKLAAQALRTLLGRFGSLRFAGDLGAKLGLAEPDHALAFADGSRQVIALWRWKDGPHAITLTGLPGKTTLIAQDGKELARADEGDALDVTIGPDVQWIEIAR